MEDKYKKRDHITENNLESFIINVRDSSDSSDSDDSLNVEFLDSDFDYNNNNTIKIHGDVLFDISSHRFTHI